MIPDNEVPGRFFFYFSNFINNEMDSKGSRVKSGVLSLSRVQSFILSLLSTDLYFEVFNETLRTIVNTKF